MTTTRYLGGVLLAMLAASPVLAQPRVTERLSVSADGAQLDEHSADPGVSPDGRYAVFLSEATSLDGCVGTGSGTFWGSGIAHIYLRDRQTSALECVSKASGGASGNARSEDPSVSADGNVVVFVSRATNLVTPATTSRPHIFARDRTAGTTRLVTVAADGVSEADAESESPRVSDDGRFVVFASRATNLVAGGTTLNREHVYRRDLVAGTTVLVSVGNGGGEGNGNSASPSITADARLVAFASTATNLLAVADGNGGSADVFVRDVVAGATELVSRDSSGAQSNGVSAAPAISADGRIVAFGSSATSLVPSATDPSAFVFVRDRQTSTTSAFAISSPALPGARFPAPTAVSGDGRFVAFRALTSPGTLGGAPGHFVHDRAVHATAHIAVGSPGNAVSPLASGPALSRDGSELFLDSNIAALIPDDTNGRMDVFVAVIPRYSTDAGVYRSSSGEWSVSRAFNGSLQTLAWGAPSLQDVPVFADYDGDGRNDVAIYRQSTGDWIFAFSSGGAGAEQWGAPSFQDRPVPADYDGDGKADKAVYRQTTGQWLVALSTGGLRADAWGSASGTDTPVPADYDGDGKADRAVYRPSTGEWFVLRSSGGVDHAAWGSQAFGDEPVPGDYDGDGKADMAVYRASTGQWFVRSSGSAPVQVTFGAPALNDVPVPADYDADGVTDIAVWRPATGEWFIWQSGLQSLRVVTLGASGDTPITLPLALR